jgi:cysteinyl-tRNA synthetase
MVQVDDKVISGMLEDREKARRFKDFRTADDIRESLQQDHSIVIDDGAREWRVRTLYMYVYAHTDV